MLLLLLLLCHPFSQLTERLDGMQPVQGKQIALLVGLFSLT